MNENIIYMILLTIDSFDTLKRAIDREDPLSKEHLIDSFEAAALFFGARKLKYKDGQVQFTRIHVLVSHYYNKYCLLMV